MNQPATSSAPKKALSAHSAIGLLSAALLYIICLSGTIAMFHHEIQRLEQPNVPEMESISDAAVMRGVAAVMEREKSLDATTHLYVIPPADDLPRAVIMTDHNSYHLDSEGNIDSSVENNWSKFIVELHYRVNLSGMTGLMIGMTIVGITGVMMLALCFTGVIALPRIFRDAFRLRARDKGGVALADWHNRLSVWTLPFGLAIAFTGAVIGMGSVTGYGVATAAYDGKLESVYSPIFGEEPEPDLQPTLTPPNIPEALDYMRAQYPDERVGFVAIHDPMTAGQYIQVMSEVPRRLVFGEYYHFRADGQFMRKVGLSDGDIGQQVAASNFPLHFGSFGGMTVKILYTIFGLALTAICATGTYIWLGKRQRKGFHEPRLRAAWHAIVWGTPLAMLIALAARVIFGAGVSCPLIFWLSLAVMVVAAPLCPNRLSRSVTA